MKIKIISLVVFVLVGCSSIEISPEAEEVTVKNATPELASKCKILGAVTGYGSSEEEAEFDIRHNAKVKLDADTVVINVYSEFIQTERMRNYIRRPELKKKYGAREHYYEQGFTLEAKGTAYLCQ